MCVCVCASFWGSEPVQSCAPSRATKHWTYKGEDKNQVEWCWICRILVLDRYDDCLQSYLHRNTVFKKIRFTRFKRNDKWHFNLQKKYKLMPLIRIKQHSQKGTQSLDCSVACKVLRLLHSVTTLVPRWKSPKKPWEGNPPQKGTHSVLTHSHMLHALELLLACCVGLGLELFSRTSNGTTSAHGCTR